MLKHITESFDKLYQNKKSLHEAFAYVTKHGLGPGMVPKGVKIIKWEEPNDYDTVIYLNRELTPAEQNEYELEFCHEDDTLKEYYGDNNVREYSDMLFDMIEEGLVDAEYIAKDLIYWCSEDDIKKYMEVNDLVDYEDEDEEDLDEAKSTDIPTKQGTIANVLSTHMKELDGIDNVGALKAKVAEIIKSSDIANKPAAKQFLLKMNKCYNKNAALSTIASYMTGIKTGDTYK